MSGGPIMIMAGGTGGHVFPGLAVADVLRQRNRPVFWLGTRRGFEARIVPQHDIEMEWVSIVGFRRRGFLAWLLMPIRVAIAVAQVLVTLYRRRPSAVLGMGGFVSGPGGIAAWMARIPLLIHEQNAIAGTTNRILSRFATRIFEAFPGSFPASDKLECIGNPVRASISALPPPSQRGVAASGRRLRVLVLGGSQGARALNRTVPEAMSLIDAGQRPEIRHQAGKGCEDTVRSYRHFGVEASVEAFIDDVAQAYGWADLVLARAGALTVSELAAAGVGSILVPYPYAVDDHQTHNARHFESAGAAVLLNEATLDAHGLCDEIRRLDGDRAQLLGMAQSARQRASLMAAEKIADACERLSGERP